MRRKFQRVEDSTSYAIFTSAFVRLQNLVNVPLSCGTHFCEPQWVDCTGVKDTLELVASGVIAVRVVIVIQRVIT